MARQAINRNPLIDALRGVSIVLVVMHHIGIRLPLSATLLTGVLPGRLLDALNWNGYESVLVFFVISGFLITRNALRRWPALGQPEFRDFYARRFARIFPCLIALVAILSILDLARMADYSITQPGQSLTSAIAAAVGLYLNWYEGQTGYLPGGWDVLWSLSIEEVFYLGFPLACLLTRRSLPAFCAALALLSLAVAFRHVLYPHNDIWREKAYLPGMAAIAAGVLAAIVGHGKTMSRSQARAASLVGFLLYAAVLLGEDLLWPYLHDATLLLLTLGTALLLLGVNRLSAPRGFMRATAWLRICGRLSYEIYLTHMFVVFAGLRLFRVMGGTDRWGFLLYPLCLMAALAVGATVARLVSQPCETALRRWFLRKRRVGAVSVA